jgi:hypothetical protein
MAAMQIRVFSHKLRNCKGFDALLKAATAISAKTWNHMGKAISTDMSQSK